MPGLRRQLFVFGVVGAASILLQAALYTVLRMVQGPLVSNLLALTVCTIVNTEANRRFTFTAPASGLGRIQLQGFIVLLGYYTITSGSLALLNELNPVASRWAEVVVLVGSSMIGTVGRFVALRSWVFGRRESAQHRQLEVHSRVSARIVKGILDDKGDQ